MNNLDKNRKEIDKIDDNIIEIGQYKKENNLPVFDAKRESAIKQKFTTKKYQDSLSNIYDTILKESKTIQYDKEHNN